jgi:nitronate monooxygenase
MSGIVGLERIRSPARACVQGHESGGHRGAFRATAPIDEIPLGALLEQVLKAVQLPVVAAGGIATGSDAARVLEIGAVAVQVELPSSGRP